MGLLNFGRKTSLPETLALSTLPKGLQVSLNAQMQCTDSPAITNGMSLTDVQEYLQSRQKQGDTNAGSALVTLQVHIDTETESISTSKERYKKSVQPVLAALDASAKEQVPEQVINEARDAFAKGDNSLKVDSKKYIPDQITWGKLYRKLSNSYNPNHKNGPSAAYTVIDSRLILHTNNTVIAHHPKRSSKAELAPPAPPAQADSFDFKPLPHEIDIEGIEEDAKPPRPTWPQPPLVKPLARYQLSLPFAHSMTSTNPAANNTPVI